MSIVYSSFKNEMNIPSFSKVSIWKDIRKKGKDSHKYSIHIV